MKSVARAEVLRSDRVAATQVMVNMTGDIARTGDDGAAWVMWRMTLLMVRPLVRDHESYCTLRDWIMAGTDVASALWLAERGIACPPEEFA